MVLSRYTFALHSVALPFPGREEKNVHNHHQKTIFWRTFLAPKKNFPGRWWIQKPYKNQENHIHHRNLSSVDPIFFFRQREAAHWSRAVHAFFFPASIWRVSQENRAKPPEKGPAAQLPFQLVNGVSQTSPRPPPVPAKTFA